MGHEYIKSAEVFKASEATLLASGWNEISKQQTISVVGIDSNESAQLIQPMPQISSMSDFMDAQILCVSQAHNSLTFSCTSIPENDIDLYIVVSPVSTSATPSSTLEEDST